VALLYSPQENTAKEIYIKEETYKKNINKEDSTKREEEREKDISIRAVDRTHPIVSSASHVQIEN
jgi:hypothetical protein